ncbi:type I restriction/modification system, methylation subunit [Campylobacter blaseri]|uniref:site-specific DNA-methyltransferase (adenine-specific) n=1 Tax=Campylobacter blaseri TaxID=2042961 RepID=A0A2P8QYX7_9BACT|nr:type I restriction-modification system subunit M [Campylobacter blaseri]PSM51445.1 DNA methyltransferase [Campylobacter blaseri]PSM52894.1 DNA methyltransferase [Campylobacter blaseri]QKF86552.1 type I restriction/modification system, methylation subunit [Campylobacter blaseri]
MGENNLVSKVWNYASVLRDSGVNYTEYVSQLTYLIFLKMDDERVKNLNSVSKIPKDCSWEYIKSLDGESLESAYTNALATLSKMDGIIGTIYQKAQNKINEPAKLKRIVSMINDETWMGLDVDVKGVIYEGLLQKNATESKSGAGQYFTPRALINTIVEVMRPNIDDSIRDPACGTGGFLLAAYEYMKKQSKDKEKLSNLKQNLSGTDISPLVVSLCAMNLYLHDIGVDTSPVKAGDSLLSLGETRYDMVLTNPPFGKKSSTKVMDSDGGVSVEKDSYERDDFIISTSNKQINFLQHIMSILKIGGRAAVVLPDNVLFEGGAGEKVRQRLLSSFRLHTILRLPTGIFYAQGVKANVLFFDKTTITSNEYATKEIWIYDFRTNQNFTLVTNPLKQSDLKDFIKCYNSKDITKRKESEKFKKFSIDEVLSREKTNLDITWLKDDSFQDLENLPEPKFVLDEILQNLQSALDEFKKIDV